MYSSGVLRSVNLPDFGLAKEGSSVLMLDLYDKVKRPEIITTSSGWLNKVNKTGNSVIAKW
jgi:hypothetical protein